MVQGSWLLDSGAVSFPPVSTWGLYAAASWEAEVQTRCSQWVFLASAYHLLLFSPVLQAEWCWAYQCSLLFWSKLEITAGKCPFFPSNGPWSLLVTGFLAGNSNAMQAGTSLSCLLQAHTCPALPGLASRALPACPRSPWPRAEGCCQVMVTQLGERCPAGSRAWVLLCSRGRL